MSNDRSGGAGRFISGGRCGKQCLQMLHELAETSSGSSGPQNDSSPVMSTRESTCTRDGGMFVLHACVFGSAGKFKVLQGERSHLNPHAIILGMLDKRPNVGPLQRTRIYL